MAQIDLKRYIRDVPDFPKKGILFKDITTLLGNAKAFKKAVGLLAKKYQDKKVDVVVGIESRGFIFGAALAYKLGAAFVPVRKKGKLPYKTRQVTYELEYGTDTLEIHEDAIPPQSRVLIIDDLLATGGTMQGVIQLVQGFQARIVGVAFLIELTFLDGRKKIAGTDVFSLLSF